MNINVALEAIATYLKLDSAQLKEYARQDDLGGFDFDEAKRRWPTGSIWGTEGQILYALVRAIEPTRIVQIGCFRGCSAAHITKAIEASESSSRLESVDIASCDELPATLEAYHDRILSDGIEWLEQRGDNTIDFLFEDDDHSTAMTEAIWKLAQSRLAPGGLIIVHDSEHWLVGEDIRAGIVLAGITDYLSLLIDPGDCGLAIWQKPIVEERSKTGVMKLDKIDPFPQTSAPELTPGQRIDIAKSIDAVVELDPNSKFISPKPKAKPRKKRRIE